MAGPLHPLRIRPAAPPAPPRPRRSGPAPRRPTARAGSSTTRCLAATRARTVSRGGGPEPRIRHRSIRRGFSPGRLHGICGGHLARAARWRCAGRPPAQTAASPPRPPPPRRPPAAPRTAAPARPRRHGPFATGAACQASPASGFSDALPAPAALTRVAGRSVFPAERPEPLQPGLRCPVRRQRPDAPLERRKRDPPARRSVLQQVPALGRGRHAVDETQQFRPFLVQHRIEARGLAHGTLDPPSPAALCGPRPAPSPPTRHRAGRHPGTRPRPRRRPARAAPASAGPRRPARRAPRSPPTRSPHGPLASGTAACGRPGGSNWPAHGPAPRNRYP